MIQNPEAAESEQHSESIYMYRNEMHFKGAFLALNEMRTKNVLCDVQLVVDLNEIPCHKSVLCSCSPYFYAMFTGPMAESKQERITIHQIDKHALEFLVDYMYTSELTINEENVQILLPAASLLQMNEIRAACCEFLISQLHPTNCLGIIAFADLHSCSELLQYSRHYSEQNFMDVVKGEEFLALALADVCQLLSSDHLSVPSEKTVYEAAMSWINYDESNRRQLAADLFQHVRMPLLPQDFLLETVDSEPLVKNDSRCKDLLIEAMKYHLMKPEQKQEMQTARIRPRRPMGIPKVMLVVGGQAPKAVRSIEAYDFKEERWYTPPDMQVRRCRAGVVNHRGMIYIIGGFDGTFRVRRVDKFDPVKDIWTSVASMEYRRSTLGAGLLNDLIYAVGGFDGSAGLNSCEVYDPKTDQWRPIASMATRRSSVGVGVLAGHVYAVGGYDGLSRQCLSTVERYDPLTDQWNLAGDMAVRRSGAGVGVVGSIMYVVGGHDGPIVRKSVESYDPTTNTWTFIADMHYCRRNTGVVTVDINLYVVGGDDGNANMAAVEVFCPKTKSWTLLPTQMTTGRSYPSVTVIDKPF